LGKWHFLYRGVDLDGQVLDCGSRPRATCRRLKPSSDGPSRRPVAPLNTSSPTRRRFIQAPSAIGRLTPGTRRPAFTTG
jgi:hypothetical protein